ncbi:MAG TPA: hypothetical protein VG755_08925, partial [Nannocystaceae bacterium]|nr:hypothetical protein [Nannocystaceae bacterium]
MVWPLEVSRNRLRTFVGILIGLAFAREARAGDVSVAWTGPPDCDGGARIERRIADDLGGAQFPATHVAIAVARSADAWRGALTIAGATSLQRELVAPSCETLADAAAIVTVVALDPFAISGRVHAAAAPPAPAPAPAPTRDVVAAAPPPVRRRPVIALRIELGASAFALPRTAAVVGLAPLVELAHWRFELPVRWHVPFAEPVRTGVDVRMQQLTVGPRGCAMPGRGAIRMLVCGGLD